MDMNSVVESTIDSSSKNAASENEANKPTVAEDVTLEQEVKQLVGSVSSWWTDFSKRVSVQDTISDRFGPG